MARYALIDGYLDSVRSEIRRKRDLDDLVAEMKDHLYSAVEHMLIRGVEPEAAQRTTLDRFGDPTTLAMAYASTSTGGISVPTQSTHRAGLYALTSAGLWLGAAATYSLMTILENQWQIFYALFAAMTLAAGVLGLMTMRSVTARLGGLGVAGKVGIAITALGVALSLVAWAVFLWMAVQGIGYLIFGIAVLRRDVAPTTSTRLITSAFAVGAIVYLLANLAKVGWRDSYGDYPLAWGIGTATGLLIITAGFTGWGTWLRSEDPSDIDVTPVTA